MMGGARPGMQPGAMAGAMLDALTPEQLDRIGERIAEMYNQARQIAEATDPEQRRELVKEHLGSMQSMMR